MPWDTHCTPDTHNLDLVVANQGSSNFSILLGNGDGTFGPAQNLLAGNAPAGVAIADFNGDCLPDLAVTNLFSGDVSILINESPGVCPVATPVSIRGANPTPQRPFKAMSR